MTILDNDQIELRVRVIVKEFIKTLPAKKPKPSEEIFIENITLLVVNVLQNINDIAFYAANQEHRNANR